MLTLMLIIAVTGVTLAVFFYVGAAFLQGYVYTEPSRDLYWQAPAAGAALALFFMIWTVLIANSAGASPSDIPYDTLFRFSPRVDLLKEPAPEVWAIKKDGEKKVYKRQRERQTSYRYVDSSYTPSRPWKADGVESVLIVVEGENYVFSRVRGEGGAYDEYVNDKGWVMKDYGDGPSGIPAVFRWGRFIMNLLLNFGHFIVWWLCLWLLLRFQWSHALGLAIVLWLVFTLSMLPMLLAYAAEVAQGRGVSPPVGQALA